MTYPLLKRVDFVFLEIFPQLILFFKRLTFFRFEIYFTYKYNASSTFEKENRNRKGEHITDEYNTLSMSLYLISMIDASTDTIQYQLHLPLNWKTERSTLITFTLSHIVFCFVSCFVLELSQQYVNELTYKQSYQYA